ncbi:MAG: PAS domain-containing protein [Deltaproteobacteria bacterium]|nr:PAS domain-containing protein [Deltaproteobacteria bacterium]
MKNSLFYKVFGTYLVITLIAMVVVGFYATGQIKSRLMERIETELTSYAQMININPSQSAIISEVNSLSRISDARITLIDSEGVVLADSGGQVSEMDNHLNRPEIQEARVKGKGRSMRFSKTLGMNTLYVALPVKEGSGIRGYIRLARPLAEVRHYVREINVLILQSFLIVAFLSFLVAFVFTSRLTSPIHEMEQFTERLREGEDPGSLMISSSDETGRLARNINYMVMELKERIRSANEEKGKLESVFASMEDGILVLDTDGRIEATNDTSKEILKARFRDIAGKTPLEAFRNIELQKALDRFKETGTPISQKIVLGEEDHTVLDVTVSPVHGLPEDEEKTTIVLHDVTRLKRLENTRADFVANVTHEIKTPLTAILGFIETLEEGAINEAETAKKFLQIIHRHAERLNRLVDDLLVISDAELGEMSFSFESVSLDGVIENVLPVIETRASEKGLVMEKEIPDNLPSIWGDRDRLHQILLNVLDNAVKFTPDAEKILIKALDGKDGNVYIKIRDTGIGIPKSEISRLGERFYRVDKARSRELGGTGLGLSIVKHLMAAHNGRIEIESQLGKGTTVSLIFPTFQEDLTAL